MKLNAEFCQLDAPRFKAECSFKKKKYTRTIEKMLNYDCVAPDDLEVYLDACINHKPEPKVEKCSLLGPDLILMCGVQEVPVPLADGFICSPTRHWARIKRACDW